MIGTISPKKAFLLAATAAFCAALPLSALEVPAMAGPVNDVAGVMTANERAELSAYLTEVSNETGTQVAVLVVNSLEGESIETYSMRVAEAWKLGQADADNGVLLTVSVADRALRVEVGYGLEDKITDVKSGLIIRQVIVPYFQKGAYGSGIIAGAKAIAETATGRGDFTAATKPSADQSSESGGAGVLAFAFFFVFFFLLRASAAGRRGRSRGIGGLLSAIFLGEMLGSMSGRHRGNGGFGGGSGFSGGGFSGGGFSGGGGGFGGGGASGHW